MHPSKLPQGDENCRPLSSQLRRETKLIWLFAVNLLLAQFAQSPRLWALQAPDPQTVQDAVDQVLSGKVTPPAAKEATGPPVTVRGAVLNAATGQPLPRALVILGSGDAVGALTDGDGHFEIPGVPSGLQTFNVIKPGFRAAMQTEGEQLQSAHMVRVAAGLPDLTFSMAPENAIRGQIALSSGDPAIGIDLTLLKLTIQDGRALWTEAGSHQSTPEGDFRFSGLEDGSYLVVTQPSTENQGGQAPSCHSADPPELKGYPITMSGDGADTASASRMTVAGGQTAQVNLVLTLSSFYPVQIALSKAPAGPNWRFTSELLDRGGQTLAYPLSEDEKTHSLCAYLPNGSYTVTVDGNNPLYPDGPGDGPLSARQVAKPLQLAGMLDFTVESSPQLHLRVPLAPGLSTPVHLRYEPGPPAKPVAKPGEDPDGEDRGVPDPLGLWEVRANGAATRADSQQNADKTENDLYELGMTPPGAYWIHASANREGTCLGTVTAGGVNLARAPWIVGSAGTGPPIDAVLRTDCAKLNLQLPAAVLEQQIGEIQSLYVYLVPEFDSIEGARNLTLRPSDGPAQPIDDLTPGAYRVFVFDAPHNLEYQNPAAMEQIAGKGQRVTLQPNGTANLTLEMPAR